MPVKGVRPCFIFFDSNILFCKTFNFSNTEIICFKKLFPKLTSSIYNSIKREPISIFHTKGCLLDEDESIKTRKNIKCHDSGRSEWLCFQLVMKHIFVFFLDFVCEY